MTAILKSIAVLVTLVGGLSGLHSLLTNEVEDSQPQPTKGEEKTDKDAATKRKPITRNFRAFAWPILFVGLFLALKIDQSAFTAKIPSLFSSYDNGLMFAVNATLIHIPIHPQNWSQAIVWGRILEIVESTKSTPNDIELALIQAYELAQRNVSVAEILQLPKIVADMDSRVSVMDALLSVFTLINLVWILSIFGLAFTAHHALFYFLKPLADIVKSIWRDFIQPALIFCQPVYEPLLYLLSFLIAVEASRYPLSSFTSSGAMVALTSLAVFGLGLYYTSFKELMRIRVLKEERDIKYHVARSCAVQASFLASIVAATLSIQHQSVLLGFMTVVMLLHSMGFSAFAMPFCLCIGFESSTSLYRSIGASSFLCLINITIQILHLSTNPNVAPFQPALSILGTSVFLLAMDLLAVFPPQFRDGGFTQLKSEEMDKLVRWYTILYATLVAFCVIAGTLLGLNGMANTGIVYAFIGLFTLFCCYRPKDPTLLGVWWFGIFAILYSSSLFLSRNPQYLYAVFFSY